MPYQGYGSCCNPLRLENHRRTKSVRQASKIIQEKWGLTRQHYLCDQCRKKLTGSQSGSKQNIVINNSNVGNKSFGSIENENDMIDNIDMFDYVNVDEIDDEINPIPSTTSAFQNGEETFSQINNLAQLSADTQLPVINQALTLLNVSPIPTNKLKNQLYLRGKVDEVCLTLKSLLNIGDDFPPEVNGKSTRSKRGY